MRKHWKRVAAVVLAIALGITSLVGIGAYSTGTDVKSDGYTIGKVEVEVLGDNNLYSAEKLTPNHEYTFTRQVKNIGINDAYVFMSLTLPRDEVYLHNLDGSLVVDAAADTQLFAYGTNGVAGINSEWALVTAGEYGNYTIAELGNSVQASTETHGVVRDNNTITYVFAYVGNGSTLARLGADETTASLFDTMKLNNISDANGQEYNIEATEGLIGTQVYAIQADNVKETTLMQGNNNDGLDAINAVWAVVNNAANDGALADVDWAEEYEGSLITVEAKDTEGSDLNASARDINGEMKETLLNSLEASGLAQADEVDALIDVKSDAFDDLADTTFDVSSIANEGDTVVILHYDETRQEWEYIATDTVDADGKVGGDFKSYSPVAFVVISGTPTEKEKASGALMVIGVYRDIYSESENVVASSAILNQLLAEEPGIYTQLASDYDMNGPYSHGYVGHGGFSIGSVRYGNITLYGNDASGCVDYAVQATYNWTKYEIVSKTSELVTVKFICDTVDFSDVKLAWNCGHGINMADYGVAIENGNLTWTTSFGTSAKTVTFKTVDTNGNPVANTYVYASMNYSTPNSPSVMFTTDANGEATIAIDKNAMPDGTYELFQLQVDGTDLLPAEGLTLTINGTNDVVITITEEIPKAQVDITGYLAKRDGEQEQPLSANITIYEVDGFDAETGTGTVVATGSSNGAGELSTFYKEVAGVGSIQATFDANTEYVIYIDDGSLISGSATFTTGSNTTQLFVYWNVDSGTLTVE